MIYSRVLKRPHHSFADTKIKNAKLDGGPSHLAEASGAELRCEGKLRR